MKNKSIITISEDVELSENIDININLEDYIDEISDFVGSNKSLQEKIKSSCDISFSNKEFSFNKKEIVNEFKLTESQLKKHLEYKSTDGNRCYIICNSNLLIKDGKIDGIYTTNASILILSANNIDKCLENLGSHEVKSFNFDFINKIPETSLSIIDNQVYSHFNINNKYSTKILEKDGSPVEIKEVIGNPSFKEDLKLDISKNDNKTTITINDEVITINSNYFKALDLDNNNYKIAFTDKRSPIFFKNEKDLIVIMPIMG